MKRLLLSISLTLIVVTSFGQWEWDIAFDDTTYLNRVVIDTTVDPNNIWKIGQPNKTVFTTANSSPNVIATDTLNAYQANDTSSFTIIHIASFGWQLNYPKIDIGGWYFMNSDTLADYGYIEFSPDQGNTWFFVDSPENNDCCTWGPTQELPTFSGNSFDWKHFYYCLCTTTPVNYGDTILYRFTFISDSIQTNKDGLMFDDLHFEDWAEGVQEVQDDNLISIYPNPTDDILFIHEAINTDQHFVQVFNCIGQLLFENKNFSGENINTKNFHDGYYLLKYSDPKKFAIKKFVVQH